jgi:hypothetical protein
MREAEDFIIEQESQLENQKLSYLCKRVIAWQ